MCILPGTWRNPRSLVEKVVESLGNARGKFANRHPNPSRFLCVFRWITPLIGLILVTTGEPKTCEHVVSLFNKHSVYMFLLQTRSSKWMFFHFLDMVQECCTLSWQIKYTHTAPIPHSLLLLAYQDGFGPYLVEGFVQDKCVFVFNGRNTGFQEPR